MIQLGIDPGASGGIAAVNERGLIGAWAMPETERDVFELICEFSTDSTAVLEQVRSRPGQGVASMFTFGWSYGGLRMALLAAGVRFTEATPQTWQKSLGLNRKFASTKDRKNAHKARAQELFPGAKVTHATADALLLAEYARRCS